MICLICKPATLGLRPRVLGIHIRQITRAHVKTIKCATATYLIIDHTTKLDCMNLYLLTNIDNYYITSG